MEIHIDLFGCRQREHVLRRFGEILQFGGPNGNVPFDKNNVTVGWGLNWDAFNDCFSYLETGGVHGTAKIIEFPLVLSIHNSQDFLESDKEGFEVLRDILQRHVEEYTKEGKNLRIVYTNLR